MKTIHVLVYVGVLSLILTIRVQADQNPWLVSAANDPGACPLSLQIDSCMSMTMQSVASVQSPVWLADNSDLACTRIPCEYAQFSTTGMDSGTSSLSTAKPADSQFNSTGPSDRVGYYLLGAIPLIIGVGNLLGIDHRLNNDDSGIWKRDHQLDLEYGVVLTEIGGGLWFGGENRIGHTFWESIDASAFSALAAQALKYSASRARPSQTSSPNQWFQGSCCESFPSGEVTLQASFVMPFILEYHQDDPWIWSLEVLPLYDAIARVKTQGHWQTDVLSSWALGTAFGIFAHNRDMPFFLSVMPHGILVGWHTNF